MIFDSIYSLPILAESWNVAWRKKGQGSILEDRETCFQIIDNTYRYWAADPFIIKRRGKVYIFAELYDYILCRGVIGCCELSDNQKAKWVPIIVEEHHLSYPCIWEEDEHIYIMPESGQAKEIAIYEAEEFPYKWKKVKVLRTDVRMVDTTPITSKEIRYAITHKVDNPYSPELCLIDLKEENGSIELGVDNSLCHRPAGHTFYYKEKRIRPAQKSLDCDKGYGKGLLFYEYYFEAPDEYEESLLKELEPKDLCFSRYIYLDGMHTYNGNEEYEVIDIKTRRINLLNLMFRFIGKLKK